MKRAAIALGLIAGTLVPALVATVWLFGCCVLPFHHTLHRIVPLCRLAIGFAHTRQSDPQPSSAPQEKQRPTPRLVAELTAPFCVSVVHELSPLVASAPAARRSFMTLGAMRCDRDVGLHTFLSTFLI